MAKSYYSLFFFSNLLLLSFFAVGPLFLRACDAAAVCPERLRAHQYIVSGQETPLDAALLSFSAVIHDATGTCTATVLNERYLLTAAHCAYSPGAAVRVAKTTREGTPDSAVRNFIPHPGYTAGVLLHDIAVVELDPPLSSYTPVYLHSGGTISITGSNNYYARSAGYGVTGSNKNDMGVFRRVDLPIVDIAACTAALRADNYKPPKDFNAGNYVCAGYVGPDSCGGDACAGDSGGPLTVRTKDAYLQIGVTSAGATCGEAKIPGVYTSIAGHLDWIKKAVADGADIKTMYYAFAPGNNNTNNGSEPQKKQPDRTTTTTTNDEADNNNNTDKDVADNGGEDEEENNNNTNSTGIEQGKSKEDTSAAPEKSASDTQGRIDDASSTNTNTNTRTKKRGKLSAGAIAGIAVGAVAALALVSVIALFAAKRLRR